MLTTAPPITRCRICGNRSLIPCVSLGAQYLSSLFPERLGYRATVPKLPLELVRCERRGETTCGLVQLAHQCDLRAMYEAYPYTSSTNSSMAGVLEDVARSGLALAPARPGDVIVDIGGNDGTLLSFMPQEAVELLSIDPAKNITPVLTGKRVRHLCAPFTQEAFVSVAPRRARLIFSIAMFYHLGDPVRFSRDVAACLDEEGVWVIQMAYLPSMLRTTMYDNIVHEHNGYYAVHQMAWIMEQAGLAVFDVTLNDVYGGSFRIFVKQRGCASYPVTDRYHRLLREESRAGLFEHAPYAAFMERVASTRADLRRLCARVKRQGQTLWVYGASTKGNTILQYCDLGKDEIVAAADANPFKLGKYMIGADLPILDETAMRAARPEYLLALPYSFVKGFLHREAQLVTQGTRFIVPLPEVRVLP